MTFCPSKPDTWSKDALRDFSCFLRTLKCRSSFSAVVLFKGTEPAEKHSLRHAHTHTLTQSSISKGSQRFTPGPGIILEY